MVTTLFQPLVRKWAKNIHIKKAFSIEIIKITMFPARKKSLNIPIIISKDNRNNNVKKPLE